jgi:hypothetical protein
MANKVPVYIVYSEHHPDDLKLARDIYGRVSVPVQKELVTMHRLQTELLPWRMVGLFSTADAREKGIQTESGLDGVAIVIASTALMSDLDERKAAYETFAQAWAHPYRRYCFCRGISPKQLSDYAGASTFLDNGVLVDETQLDDAIRELNKYLSHERVRIRPPAHLVFRLRMLRSIVALLLCTFLEFVSKLIYALKIFLIPVLLATTQWPVQMENWIKPLALTSAYAAGLTVNIVPSLDLWPWLRGRNLVASRVSMRQLAPFGLGPISFWSCFFAIALYSRSLTDMYQAGAFAVTGLLIQLFIDLFSLRFPALRRGREAEPASTETEHANVAYNFAVDKNLAFRQNCVLGGISHIALLFGLAFFLEKMQGGADTGLLVVAFCGGLFTHTLIRWLRFLSNDRTLGGTLGQDRVKRIMGAAGTNFGISPDVILAEQETLPDDIDGAERSVFVRLLILCREPWLLLHITRRWFRIKDRAFISYAWRDDARLQVAGRLSLALGSVRITHYYDKLFAERYAGFQDNASPALNRCSHFFLVVSDGLSQGEVVMREIKAALHRWQWGEGMPAIVNIGARDAIEALAQRKDLPLELRFVLKMCPSMTIGEAANPHLLGRLTKGTRRQGKLRDWIGILSKTAARRQIMEADFRPGDR